MSVSIIAKLSSSTSLLIFLWGCCINSTIANPQVDIQPNQSPNHQNLNIPKPPVLGGVRSYVVVDADSGHIVAAHNPTEQLPPASLTKVMTLYLVAEALQAKRLHLDDLVTVSEKAWRTGGSRMFIGVGTQVSIRELIAGIAVASGNDATVAMAEHLAGDETTFVEMMNKKAQELQMHQTHYADCSGLPHRATYSTAADQAKLAQAWIKHFPLYYPWFKEKWMAYNKIKQPNRNRLLWLDGSVDGIKTGHTDEAGYCLISSAKRGQMRLISVVMGARDEGIRSKQSLALIRYGYRFFETKPLLAANYTVKELPVFFGEKTKVAVGAKDGVSITIPAGKHVTLKANIMVPQKPLRAPVPLGQPCGILNIVLDGKVVITKELVTLTEVKEGGFLSKIIDHVRLMFAKS